MPESAASATIAAAARHISSRSPADPPSHSVMRSEMVLAFAASPNTASNTDCGMSGTR